MPNDRRQVAQNFLALARAGDRNGAAELVTPDAKHHNAYFGAGMSVLLDAIVDAARRFPDGDMSVKHVLADGDFVAVHSHVRHQPGDAGVAVVHLFRFDGTRIAEMWDIGQAVPADSPNADGMF